jgi:hypothetical protein
MGILTVQCVKNKRLDKFILKDCSGKNDHSIRLFILSTYRRLMNAAPCWLKLIKHGDLALPNQIEGLAFARPPGCGAAEKLNH